MLLSTKFEKYVDHQSVREKIMREGEGGEGPEVNQEVELIGMKRNEDFRAKKCVKR